ncbi:hypothetical protein CBR_g40603 [Chara braunii]|uniref:Integrase catalytic domain-containing protein n=1 Tax=Chara braunii TaxID=69332 RepID=A0A388LTY9_CHABU|nr:hypothetical protein CBR_g40603 [Chara braunii]|eukprot:GBG85794.1 hypothetical protein CBR_g40603 [Chara braunii]
MSDREETGEDDRRLLRSARGPITHVSLGPQGDRELFRRQRERQQQRRARAAEASRALASEAGATAAMATTAMSTSAQQTSQAGSSGTAGSTVAQTVSQSTGLMASQPAVLTLEDVAIQQAALQEAQLQQALGQIKREKEMMIRRRTRLQRRGADIEELETMDLTNMDDDVRVVRRALLGVMEMQEHQTTILQDIQQSLAILVGRSQAAPSPGGPGAWPVPYPPFSVPPVTGVSPFVAPSTVAVVSLGMPLSGGLSAGPSLQDPVQSVVTKAPSQVAISGQSIVSQTVQPQGTQPQQLAQQPVSPGPQPGLVQGPGQSQWVPKMAITAPKPFTGDKRGEDLDTWLRAVPVYVRCKLTLPHEEVLVAASYLEGSAARWLSGNQLAKEANINMHNFPSFSKVALDLEAKIGHGHNSVTDRKKKTLPPNWKAKGRIMFVDHDGATIELDDDSQLGVGAEAGGDTSEGGVVVAVTQKGALITEYDLTDDVTRSLVEAYREDQFMSKIIRRLEAKDKQTSAKFELVNGLLFLEKEGNKRLCVPNKECMRSLFLGECHDATDHFGYKKTATNLLQRFWWPTMLKDAKLYVETCQVCQRDKPRTQAPLGLLKPLPIPERPGESLSMDFMDTLVTSKSGMRQIFVIVDRFSKYARLIAMSETAKTEYVIRLFKENWVRDFGLPKSIVSDRDVRFTSELWKAAAAEQGTQLQMTS